MIKSFRDRYLEQFYLEGKRSRLIPGVLERQLARKLDILAAAQQERDLHHPTGNYYKRLSGPLQAAIRAISGMVKSARQYALAADVPVAA